jgi:hypothetical protein
VSVLLVRHAKAGDREKWDAPDDLRPLTAKGEAQAEALVDLLAGYDIDRVLSSPYLRCTQTVAPLASARGLAVEPCDDLAEGEGRAGIALTRSLPHAEPARGTGVHRPLQPRRRGGGSPRRSGRAARAVHPQGCDMGARPGRRPPPAGAADLTGSRGYDSGSAEGPKRTA